MAENAARLACDFAVISDTSQFAPGIPAITYGLKGLAYFELLVQGANRDLHSGTFGGAVANPINALCDDPRQPQGAGRPDPDRRLLRRRPAARGLGAGGVRQAAVLRGGIPGATSPSPRWTARRATPRWNGSGRGRPATSTASSAATPGPGPKTVLPCKAGAKLSFRLVPDQDPRTVDRQFREHVARVCPPGVTYEIITHHGAPAVLVDVDTPGVRAAVRAVEAGFGTRPVFMREGGSIPVVGLIKQHLGVDTLLLGWGQNDDNLHGPNEKFSLADFHRGIKSAAHLLAELAGESVDDGAVGRRRWSGGRSAVVDRPRRRVGVTNRTDRRTA